MIQDHHKAKIKHFFDSWSSIETGDIMLKHES
jgi:hypothetical protein